MRASDGGSADTHERLGAQRFLTLQQVADELNVTLSLVRAVIASGRLAAIQVGGRGQWRIERLKLEEYIADAYARTRNEIANGRFAVERDQPSTEVT
jgi:prophage regulatory protein